MRNLLSQGCLCGGRGQSPELGLPVWGPRPCPELGFPVWGGPGPALSRGCLSGGPGPAPPPEAAL